MSTDIYEVIVLYKITNQVNQKVYIGITEKDIRERFNGHRSDSQRGSDFRLHRAMRKHGAENFIIEQIGSATNRENAKNFEVLAIAQYESYTDPSKGYNMTPGGDYRREGITYSDQGKANCSAGQKRRYEDPNEREKNRQAQKKVYSDPELRESQRQTQLQIHEERPELAAAASERTTKYYEEHPEAREAHSKLMLEKNKQPGYSEMLSRTKSTPEAKANFRQSQIDRYKDPEERAKSSRSQFNVGANRKAAKSLEFVGVLREAFKQQQQRA